MIPAGPALTRAAHSAAADPVEIWKALARAHVVARLAAPSVSPRVSVRVSRGFVLLMLALGLPFGVFGPVLLLGLVLSVLLVHELPRAWVARRAGRSAGVLISVQGAETQVSGPSLTGGTRGAFAVAGSLANLAFGGVAWALSRHHAAGAVGTFLLWLAQSHGAWALAQALPLVPFHAGRALAESLKPSARFMHAAGSLIVAMLAVVLLAGSSKAAAVLPLIILVLSSCVRAAINAHGESRDERMGIGVMAATAERRLAAGDAQRAASVAIGALDLASSPRRREGLWRILAWAAIGRQDPFAAHAALGRVSPADIDPHLVASYLACCNRIDEARALLEQIRELGHAAPETSKLLIDLCYRRGDLAAVRAVFEADAALLSPDEHSVIGRALAPLSTRA